MSNNRPVHVFAVVAYAGAAAMIAFLLPWAFDAFSPAMTQIWGAIILLSGVMVHELLRRHGRERIFAQAIVKHSRTLSDTDREWTHARLELEALRESIEASSQRLSGDAKTEVEQIRGEMELLRKMIDKVMTAAEAHAMPMRLAVNNAPMRKPPWARPAEFAVATDSDEMARPDPPPSRDTHPIRPSHPAKPAPAPTPADVSVLQTIREALKANRIELHVQQVVTLPERRRRYFECYSRLRTVMGEYMFPQQYLPVAERTGLTSTIDNVLLLRCIQLIRKLQQRNLDIGFFCNISTSTLKDRVFLDEFASLIANNRLLARSLVFEFRQADFALIEAEASDYLERLAAAGFRFSVDHVTSIDVDVDIRALAERHVRFLKIPGSMLVAAAGGMSPVPLREIQSRLKAADIELVAERIETKAVLRTLEANGVALGQGFLLGEPVLSQDR